MVKSKFSIKDLENLSGIKAHTIRMWERRHKLLEPDRTDSNIRFYNIESLQKILNVSYLKSCGLKISTIALLPDDEIESEVRSLAMLDNLNNHNIQLLKLAMVNFDKALFNKVYDKCLRENDFDYVFKTLFLPFLKELGFLWQSKSVNVAHEHFISYLIKQKLLIHIEKVTPTIESEKKYTFILFLPDNEMHELGLLFLNYELLRAGMNTVYLGSSMPLDSLSFFKDKETTPIFVTYITVYPAIANLGAYLRRFNRKVSPRKRLKLWLLGNIPQELSPKELAKNQKVFKDITTLMKSIPNRMKK